MVTDVVQKLLEVGFGGNRVHHEAVLRSISRQSIQVALERLILLVGLLENDSDVSGIEIESRIWDHTGVVNDL